MSQPIPYLLYDLQQPALIMLNPTGPLYQQQTAGVACCQQRANGHLLPLPPQVVSADIEQMLTDADGITEETADEIERCWADADYRIQLKVNRERLHDSQEAWLHVVSYDPEHPGFAVLTWMNSD